MGVKKSLIFSQKFGILLRVLLSLWFWSAIFWPVNGLRPLRDSGRSWGDEWLFVRKDENDFGLFSAWNITGTYRGSWRFLDSTTNSSRLQDFRKSKGNSNFELITTPTKINGVHYVQGLIIFHDEFDNEHEVGGAQIRVEGVYIWPFRQLRLVASSRKEGEFNQEDDYILSNPYHLVHSKRRNRLEQQRLSALVFVKARHQKRILEGDSYDPICLSDLEFDDEWITEKEDAALPEDTTWMNVNECFNVQEEESSKKRKRGPRDLNEKKGKEVVELEDENDDEGEDDDVQEVEEDIESEDLLASDDDVPIELDIDV